MRPLAFVATLSLVGCTQILDLDDAVVVRPEQTVTVPPLDAVLVDGGGDADAIDAVAEVASDAPADAKD
jgi:hypothetical protein